MMLPCFLTRFVIVNVIDPFLLRSTHSFISYYLISFSYHKDFFFCLTSCFLPKNHLYVTWLAFTWFFCIHLLSQLFIVFIEPSVCEFVLLSSLLPSRIKISYKKTQVFLLGSFVLKSSDMYF